MKSSLKCISKWKQQGPVCLGFSQKETPSQGFRSIWKVIPGSTVEGWEVRKENRWFYSYMVEWIEWYNLQQGEPVSQPSAPRRGPGELGCLPPLPKAPSRRLPGGTKSQCFHPFRQAVRNPPLESCRCFQEEAVDMNQTWDETVGAGPQGAVLQKRTDWLP